MSSLKCIWHDHKNGYPSPGDIGPNGKCVMTSCKACNGLEKKIKIYYPQVFPLAIPLAILLLFLLS